MLLTLKVKNYALIDDLYVEFLDGLNIITGETGAGKSILLGALGLILGKRADLGALSNKDKKCVVEAEFNIKEYAMQSVFTDADVDYDEHTVIRREILSSGKSRAFINDTPVNLNVLQGLALKLVDIHSQHQNLLLNKQVFLLSLIDRYCKNGSVLEHYKALFNKYRIAENKYQEKFTFHKKINEELDFLSHQLEELNEAKLVQGEHELLEKEIEKLENSGEIKSAMHEINSILSGEENGVVDQISVVQNRLSKVSVFYSKASELLVRFNEMNIELKDIQLEIEGGFDNLDFDPQRYDEVKARLDLLNSLMLRHKKANTSELIELQQELKEKVSVAIDGSFDLEKQKKELDLLYGKLEDKAQKISKIRRGSFKNFEKEIISILSELGMSHSAISLTHSDQEISENGIDSINFLFSANKNHELQEVSKIASGGELSRLMLSIKTVVSNSIGMPTIILDEIDTGVSGEVANKVGNIINKISLGVQVINITHLPQVASKGHSHFLVYKDHEGNSTKTLMRKLTEAERLEEIAKMLSGDNITQAALENAKVLLQK